MKPTTAILAAVTLLVAWAAMPSVAGDVTDDSDALPVVRNKPDTPELQRTPKPCATPAPKAEQPEKHDGRNKPSAKTGAAKTLLAADSKPRAQAMIASGTHGARKASRLHRAAASGAKQPHVSISRKAIGKRTVAPRAQKLTANGSRRPASPRAGMKRTPRRVLPFARTMKDRLSTAPSAKVKPPGPVVRPPLVVPSQPSPAAAQAPTRSAARRTLPAPRPVVTTPPRRQQPARPPRVIEQAPPLDEWEKYVSKTAARYQFTDAQDAKARSILTDLKHRAKQYQLTRAPAFEKAERLQDEGARAARLKQLNRPIDLLFDELKQRLDNLPTIPQKHQANRHAA